MKKNPLFIYTLYLIILVSANVSGAAKQRSNLLDTAKLPSSILDLTNWELTIPISNKTNGFAADIKQPELQNYTSGFFFTNQFNNAVIFKAFVNGVTTSGSNFPRSELREMTNEGKEKASWSSSTGIHTLFIDQAVMHLPDVRPQMVIGQIHDASEYVIFFRIENNKLLVEVNQGEVITLDDNYKLGTRFNVKFVVSNNQTACFYNNVLKYIFKGSFDGAYFKAGAYVQSSDRGKKETIGELPTAYGEVEIFNTWVKHEYK